MKITSKVFGRDGDVMFDGVSNLLRGVLALVCRYMGSLVMAGEVRKIEAYDTESTITSNNPRIIDCFFLAFSQQLYIN